MNFREMNRAVFAGDPLPHPFFQPRIEPWFAWHTEFDCMPAQYAAMSLPEFFDYLGVSMRYVQYYTGQPEPITFTHDAAVQIEERVDGDTKTVIFHTPHGVLQHGLALVAWHFSRVLKRLGRGGDRPFDCLRVRARDLRRGL